MSNRPKSQTTRAQARSMDTADESRSSLVWIGVAGVMVYFEVGPWSR